MKEYSEGKLHSGSKKGPVVGNRKQAVAIALSEAKRYVIYLFLVGVFSCTYNVSMAHTEGQAIDTIDDTQTPSNNVSPNLNLPLMPK